MKRLMLSVIDRSGAVRATTVTVGEVILAGYTGRDRDHVRRHIAELQALGVAPPPRVPMFYRVDPRLLTTAGRIDVGRPETSGEAEVCLVGSDEGLLVGVGSDHTDRAHEAIDVAASKALCEKPVSAEVWLYEDVRDSWDRLTLRSFCADAKGRRPYQEGRLEALLTVEELLAALRSAGHGDIDGKLLFCGTVPARDGIVYGRRFEAKLVDPVQGRSLTCAYDVA